MEQCQQLYKDRIKGSDSDGSKNKELKLLPSGSEPGLICFRGSSYLFACIKRSWDPVSDKYNKKSLHKVFNYQAYTGIPFVQSNVTFIKRPLYFGQNKVLFLLYFYIIIFGVSLKLSFRGRRLPNLAAILKKEVLTVVARFHLNGTSYMEFVKRFIVQNQTLYNFAT